MEITIHINILTITLIVLYLLIFGICTSIVESYNHKRKTPLMILLFGIHTILFSPILIPILLTGLGQSFYDTIEESIRLYGFFKKGN